MIIEPKLIDRNRDEVSINKDNFVLNGRGMFLHYRRNAEGNFDIVYTKNNIGAKAYYNNQIWVLLNPNKVITKTRLLDLISLDAENCDENSLKVHISNIRKKIRQVMQNEYIEAIWGIGFKIKE